MELMFKAAAVSVTAAVAALLIKDGSKELSYVLSIAAVTVLSICAIKLLGGIKELAEELIASSGLSSALFLPLIKCAGIAATVKISSALCKDAGQSAAAAAAEYVGAAAAVCTALPLMSSILSALKELT